MQSGADAWSAADAHVGLLLDLSILETAGPGGPVRTRGPPHLLAEGFHPVGWATSP